MTFTNGAYKDSIVLPKYAMTFSAVIEKADALSLVGVTQHVCWPDSFRKQPLGC